MGLQQSLADRPAVTNTITVAVIAVALAFIAYDVTRPRAAGLGVQRLYFSTDDGATYFADTADKQPPYDVNGKQAVRVYVYACEGGRPFVAYLERYTPETLAKFNSDEAKRYGLIDREFILADGTEVKRPGDADWVLRKTEAGEKILDVKCPTGESGVPMSRLPGD